MRISVPVILLSTAALLNTTTDLQAASLQRSAELPQLGRSVPPPFPLPPAAWLDDVHTGTGALACGNVKCLYGSRADGLHRTTARPHHGYLVAQQNRPQEVIAEGWDLARDLEAQFAIRHLFLAAPRRMNCTAGLVARLGRDAKLSFVATKQTADQDRWRKTQLIVQPVELAPENSILFGCYRVKKAAAYAALENYFAAHYPGRSAAAGRREFAAQLQFDHNATVRMLTSPEGACMANDFQVLVEPGTGRIYHLDFDRCHVIPQFEPQQISLRMLRTCVDDLNSFLHRLIAKRMDGTGNITLLNLDILGSLEDKEPRQGAKEKTGSEEGGREKSRRPTNLDRVWHPLTA